MGLSMVGGIVAYQIYSSAIKTQNTAEQTAAIKPLDGVIDQATIDSLKKRVVYSNAEMSLSLGTAVVATPEAAITPTAPTSTNSATTQ